VPPFDAQQIARLREALQRLGDAEPATTFPAARTFVRGNGAELLEDSETERLALADEAVSLARDLG